MRAWIAAVLCVAMVFGTAPARADFKYSDTSKITGGALKNMMKTVGIFSKQASQAMKPITTTRYIKGDRMRSDDTDGRIQIIDLAGRRMINIDPQKKTYTEITFDEMKASLDKASQQMSQPQKTETKDANGKPQDVNAKVNAKVTVTPGTGSRQIQGVTTNEMKVQIDMEVQAQQQNPPPGQNGQASGTMTTVVDSWVAPTVPGYEEVTAFYQRMAKEVNWVPPSNIRIDPRVAQGMDEVQKNSSAYKGLPLLQYLSMTMVAAQGNGTDASASGQNGNAQPSNSNDNAPTSASDAMVKGLGGLFGKRKKKDDDQANPNNPPPPSTPGSLIEMTIEVTNFSNAALDGALFEIPEGYTRVKQNPDQVLQQSKP